MRVRAFFDFVRDAAFALFAARFAELQPRRIRSPLDTLSARGRTRP